ncbi:MAG: PEP-CTERM sorting domain-containing protein [Candidatus Auribacterota bacterium]
MKRLIFITCIILSIASIAGADPLGKYYKWSQFPDMDASGYDVPDVHPNILADDFLCENGLDITDIHWWGSLIGWQQDLPMPDPALAPQPDFFDFSFHTDVPAGPNSPYSHPGGLLATDQASKVEYTVNYFGTIDHGGIFEHVFQYNFDLHQYWQQQQGQIYWLDISAIYAQQPMFTWGWHTAKTQWNDSAVMLAPGTPQGWAPIDSGEPRDLAFELSTVPEPGAMILFGMGGFFWLVKRIRKHV